MTRFLVVFFALLIGLFTLQLTPIGQAVVVPWTATVASVSAAIATLIDPSVIANGAVLSDQRTGFGVVIMAGCNGVEAMIILFAAMMAFPATLMQRLLGLLAGFVAVQSLNLVRILSLFYLGQWSKPVFDWAHLYGWQVLIMLDVLIVWLLWVRLLSRAPAVKNAAAPEAASA
jgi:exosortase H (IPTLxxWG-CTERM-specific)